MVGGCVGLWTVNLVCPYVVGFVYLTHEFVMFSRRTRSDSSSRVSVVGVTRWRHFRRTYVVSAR